jgi:phage-related protein
MATFTGVPDQGCDVQTSLRFRKAEFGDGYEQRIPDGLNYIKETWSVSFTLRTKTEILAHDTFLRANAASFDWVTPKSESKKFKCENWSMSPMHDGNWSLSGTFEQVFEV